MISQLIHSVFTLTDMFIVHTMFSCLIGLKISLLLLLDPLKLF